ncbi:MAG: hypothetical protein ACOC53_07970 [Candidatus Saliniplasma sp.]
MNMMQKKLPQFSRVEMVIRNKGDEEYECENCGSTNLEYDCDVVLRFATGEVFKSYWCLDCGAPSLFPKKEVEP